MPFIQFPAQLPQEKEVKLFDTGNWMRKRSHDDTIPDNDVRVNNMPY